MSDEKDNSVMIEFDCSEAEKPELERKMQLLTFGNGKDLCFFSCDAGHCCIIPKLTVKQFEDMSEKAKKHFWNGGIEISSKNKISSFTANSCDGCFCDLANKMISVSYSEKGLFVVIRA